MFERCPPYTPWHVLLEALFVETHFFPLFPCQVEFRLGILVVYHIRDDQRSIKRFPLFGCNEMEGRGGVVRVSYTLMEIQKTRSGLHR
jgi:hypothetical protein